MNRQDMREKFRVARHFRGLKLRKMEIADGGLFRSCPRP